MKKFRYNIPFILSVTLLAVLLNGCKKLDLTADIPDNPVVYAMQATTDKQELTLFPFIDEARTFKFNAGVGAIGYPGKDITVKFEIDNAAFDSINLARQQAGLPLYLRFPTDAYTIDVMETTIPAGQLTSNSVTVSYFSKKFDPLKNYLLPISIKDASGYVINPKVKTVFIVASKLEGKAITASVKSTWSITADSEELTGEGAVNGRARAAIDGDISTYWHSQWVGTSPPYPHWLSFDMGQAYYIDKIGLAPRQNNSNGFIKFKWEASMDGTNWTTMGDNLVFDPTKRDGTFQDYLVPVTQVRYIKITLLEPRVAGATSTHLGEINVYRL